jgi:hypothetical protein
MASNEAHEAFQYPPSMPPPPPPKTLFNPSRPSFESDGQTVSAPLQETPRDSDVKLSSYSVSRKPVPMPTVDASEGAYVQQSPLSAVRVHPPSDWPQPEPSSVTIEDHGSQISPSHSRTPSGHQSIGGHSVLSNPLKIPPSSPAMPIYFADDASNVKSNNRASQLHRRGKSLPDASGHLPLPQSSTSQAVHSGAGNVQPSGDTYQPLQYHHQSMEDRSLRPIDKRASKITMRSTYSDGSSNSDPNLRNDHLAPSNVRNSFGGRLTRPDSAYSSISDLAQSRGRSPQMSPNGHARASPTHSATPSSDHRPLSYVDLLNVPYPQPPPVSADHRDNAKLRTAIGNNASLLSTRQTLEMYRANVKKTNDPAIQYEFAVFMISAAQEVPPEPENASASESSYGATHGDLLKEARQILQRLSDRSYPFAQYYFWSVQ